MEATANKMCNVSYIKKTINDDVAPFLIKYSFDIS